MAKKDDDNTTDQAATTTTTTTDTESATTYEEALQAGYFGTRIAHPGPTEDSTVNEALA